MKVFISSTYEDLINYRAAAIEAVEGTSYQALKMEVFGARPDGPKEACLKEIEQSNLFIGIYAHRYGYVPDGGEISITEMEYLHAKKLDKPIYCFVVDEDNQPWLPKWIEDKPGKSKLQDFKNRIQTNHIVAFFTTPDDLGKKVANALSHYVATEQSIPDNQNPIYQPPKPTGSTLPRQPYFFGRAKELETITAALSPETRTWGVLIDGPGGIGKTSLAIKAAHDASTELFERKIFITAKVRDLTPTGEKELTDFTRQTYLAMLDELGKELGEDGIEKLAPDERPNTLRLALAGGKALIVFDNLETLPEDERERLFQFLSRLPEGNKAIVTSRRRTDVEARILRLDRLSRAESLELIAKLAEKYPRLARTTEKDRTDLYEISQGNPLFIRWIAGQLGRKGSQFRTIAEISAFIDKASRGNDPLEYIFGDLLETFTANEIKVLAALTYFSQPVKLKWIAEIADLAERAAETALEDLTDRSILTSDLVAQTYFLPPLTAKFIRTRRPKAVIQTGDTLAQRVSDLVLEYGGPANYEGFNTLDAEWDFIFAALPLLLTGDIDRLETTCAKLNRFLNFTGRWDDWLWLWEQAEKRAIATDNQEYAGWCTFWAGNIYSLRNQATEVLSCASRTAEFWQDSSPEKKATAIHLRGIGHELEKDYSAAIAAYREVLEIHRSISLESWDVASILGDLGNVEKLIKDYSAAERHLRESLRISKIIKQDESIAISLGDLAALDLDRGQWAEAEALAREALTLAEKIGRQDVIAEYCHILARSLLKQNYNLDEAFSLSRRAVDIMARLRHIQLPEAQETLADLEQARDGK